MPRAAVLRQTNGLPQLEEIVLQEPGPGELIVRIAGVGVCQTDLGAIDGVTPLPLPAVVGHEGAGVVEAVGPDVTTHAPGDEVVLTFDSCGTCDRCEKGRPAYCRRFNKLNSSGFRRDGSTAITDVSGAPIHGSFCGQSSFATHALASTRNAIRVETKLPLELLGPLGCSMQTGAGTVLNVLKPEPGSTIAIFGVGAVGLAAVMGAKIAGCGTIIVIDGEAGRVQRALELGATHVVDTQQPDPDRAVKKIVRGGVDYAVDAVGLAKLIPIAVKSLASPGVCATLGFHGLENRILLDQGHLLQGRSLVGVIEGDVDPRTFIPHLLELNAAGRFPFDRLLTIYPFEEIGSALDDARHRRVLKPVIRGE